MTSLLPKKRIQLEIHNVGKEIKDDTASDMGMGCGNWIGGGDE